MFITATQPPTIRVQLLALLQTACVTSAFQLSAVKPPPGTIYQSPSIMGPAYSGGLQTQAKIIMTM